VSASDSTADLREAILDAANELLLDTGYAGITMRKVADRIGYSATTIYLHFRNKDALLHALIERGYRMLHGAMHETATQHADPIDRIEALCRCYVQFGLDHPAYYEVMFMLHPRFMQRYPSEKYREARRNLDAFAQTLVEAQRSGQARVHDLRAAANAIWAMLHGVVSLQIARRMDVRVDRDVLVETTIRGVVRAIAPFSAASERAA
jgi:AcrR family transcriptional regulator